MRIITVNEYSSMPGRYQVEYRDDNATQAVCAADRDGHEAAAASAVNLGISAGEYIIFGSKKVLDCIPENLRSKQ